MLAQVHLEKWPLKQSVCVRIYTTSISIIIISAVYCLYTWLAVCIDRYYVLLLLNDSNSPT